MVKVKLEKKIKDDPVSVIIVILVFMALSVGVLIYMHVRQDSLIERHRVFWALALEERRYETDKLEFCVDNDIKPCTDEAIKTWNDEHGDNQFTLKSYQTLVEDSIQWRLMMDGKL